MPFKSEAQRRFLFAKHPEIAKRWTQEYGSKPVSKERPSLKALKRAASKPHAKS